MSQICVPDHAGWFFPDEPLTAEAWGRRLSSETVIHAKALLPATVEPERDPELAGEPEVAAEPGAELEPEEPDEVLLEDHEALGGGGGGKAADWGGEWQRCEVLVYDPYHRCVVRDTNSGPAADATR